MYVTMRSRDAFGKVRLCPSYLNRVRLIESDSLVRAAFELDVTYVGVFPECRLLQRRDGGFFVTGEWLLDAQERHYPRFVTFLDPYSEWLAQAVRIELVGILEERYGPNFPNERDDRLRLDDYYDPTYEHPPISDEKFVPVRIEHVQKSHTLLDRKPRFDAIIGESVRLHNLRIVGKRGEPRLVLPTSEGLSLRPIFLETHVSFSIAREAVEFGFDPTRSVA